MAEKTTGRRKRVRGIVKSDKMDLTVTVLVERLVQDPRYGKYLRRHSTFMAHNVHNDARQGDLVEIEETRPLSRRKRWRVVRILRRALVPAEQTEDLLASPDDLATQPEPTA